ncbi:hypothetical protein K8089_15755 [Aequorivita sp. F47161]|uniref:Uncharacterized protein n=1 Tax=Aequorivita vitellina TaxID=2874475 RepID=A0A9X1R003_9FLAO|nr:hypothetical protein [Aequorivita vitellina]MCG2420477.1 hypothetical protein [Aequorivita vitellina]
MKKAILVILGLILIIVAVIYISLWTKPENAKTDIVIAENNIDKIDFEKLDSVRVAATTMYEGDMLKKLMQGEQYRDEWATPVKVPVVFLDRLHGGLSIIKKGGGKQTKSLRLKNDEGMVYTLRSVAKDPDPLIPEFAKTVGIENIITDGVSAQHPYGAMVAAKLSDAINIQHTHPSLAFVPKQKQLGPYNEVYGNKLYWLEYETEGEKNWSDLENIIALIDTEELQEEKVKYGDSLKIDTKALVRNRLFDMVIGDWDRHTKQWGWFLQKQENQYTAIPLASDRDNAFFSIDGVLPSLISSKNIQPRLRPFEREIAYMPGLVYPFDIYFLKEVPKDVFIKEAKYIQTHLTDAAIDAAFAIWPKEIYTLHGEEIKEILTARRDHIDKYAVQFYEVLKTKEYLLKPLKGSDDVEIPSDLYRCFECL